METRKNPAYRFHAFLAELTESVWPGGTPGRLHRSYLPQGRRVSYERLATDAWQRASEMWPATEQEAADWAAHLPDPCAGLPF